MLAQVIDRLIAYFPIARSAGANVMEVIQISLGEQDAGKIIVTNEDGVIDASVLALDFSSSDGIQIIGSGRSFGFSLTDITPNSVTTPTLTVSSTLSLPANSVTLTMLSDHSACSVFGRAVNSVGDPSSIVSIQNGDQVYRENNTVVFDSWVRQRRNVMRGFWDFEFGNGDALGTALGDGVLMHGTPFTTRRAGSGLISQASRGTTYSRNCVTLGCYSVNDEAGFYAIDIDAAVCGLPVSIGTVIVELGVRCNVLSASTNDYVINIGFVSDNSITGKGVYFQYDRASTGSNVWRIVAKSTLQSVTTTGAAVAVSGEYRLRIEVASSSSAAFYVNGTLVGTLTDNIPSLLGLGALLKRNTSSAGAVAYWDIDYIGYQLSTTRSATQR